MGADKARLPWKGRTLLEHQFGLLEQAGCARVLVSGGYSAFPHVRDLWPQRGPLGGLASVAAEAEEPHWLVLAVDQPLVDVAMLRALRAGLDAAIERGRGVCRFGEEQLPMAMVAGPEIRLWMEQALHGSGSGASLKYLQERLRVHTLAADAGVRARLRGANTPDEWQALLLSA
ncbi:MAG: hypothetical protein AMXMBFR25_06080 [Lysobacterales bacterium]|nr:Molybdenum cofactor guanylyltransferase [Xanthomonadales bacterium]